MNRRVAGVCFVALLATLLVFAGCGGGGDDNGNGNGEPDDWTLPEAMALPNPGDADVGGADYQQWLANWDDESNLPSNAAELQQELDRWAAAVEADPNDAAAQMGLSMVILAMSGQNGAQDLGYNLFEELDLQEIASLHADGDLSPEAIAGDALNTACLGALPKLPGVGTMQPAQVTSEDLVDWQQAVRTHLLPAVQDVLERMRGIAGTAETDVALVSYVDEDTVTHSLYAADFSAIVALMDLLHAPLLQIAALNPDYGTHEWDRTVPEMDVNGDGVLTVAEYLPPAPFLNIDAALWQQAGTAMRDAVNHLIQAIDDMPAPGSNSILAGSAGDEDLSDLRETLVELGEMLAGEVTVSIEMSDWEEPAPAEWVNPVVENLRFNMREIWDNPAGSLRALLPPLYVAPLWAEYATSANVPGGTLSLDFDSFNPDTGRLFLGVDPFTGGMYEVPVTIGAGAHTVAFDPADDPALANDVNLVFDPLWDSYTGTVDGLQVEADLAASESIEYTVVFRWDQLPDRTFSGVFPDTATAEDIFFSIRDRYLITYGDTIRIDLIPMELPFFFAI